MDECDSGEVDGAVAAAAVGAVVVVVEVAAEAVAAVAADDDQESEDGADDEQRGQSFAGFCFAVAVGKASVKQRIVIAVVLQDSSWVVE